MGFYPQPNSWMCGPFALKHALAVWGRFVPEWDLARVAGSDPSGTDEHELGRAAAALGFNLGMERFHDVGEGHRALLAHLRAGVPTLLCIEQWDHWVTAVAEENDDFVLLDSRFPSVVRVLSREVLLGKWRYHDPSAAQSELYDLHPLEPRLPTRVAARFTLERARALMRFDNLELTRRWSELASYLVELGALSSTTDPDLFAVSLAEYLSADREGMHAATGLPPAAVDLAVSRLRFVAETYDLVLRLDDTERLQRALADIVRRAARLRDVVERPL